MLPASVALALCLLSGGADVPPVYRVVVLPGFSGPYAEALDISNDGKAVGIVKTSIGVDTAAIWSARGELDVIGRLETTDSSRALGISPNGRLVAGYAVYYPSPSFAVLWTLAGEAMHLPVPSPSGGLAVNDAGFVLCTRPAGTCLLLGRDGAQYAIGGQAVGLSSDGTVAAYSEALGAFRWSISGGYEDMPTPAGYDLELAQGIGPDGTVCGWAWGLDIGERRACLWPLAGSPTLLPHPIGFASTDTTALDVNASGWAVGWSWGHQIGGDPELGEVVGVLWVGGVGYQIRDLLEPGSPVQTIPFAWALNDAGQIVATGRVNGEDRAIRLDPL